VAGRAAAAACAGDLRMVIASPTQASIILGHNPTGAPDPVLAG
jgi:hypothetical protein